jgi:hypothetical protein
VEGGAGTSALRGAGSAPPSTVGHGGVGATGLASTEGGRCKSRKTSRCEAASRQSASRRCRVRSWPSGKPPGWADWIRASKSAPFWSGSASSQPLTSGHTLSKASLWVRHVRAGRGLGAWVGRTSPAFQASARLERNSFRSACEQRQLDRPTTPVKTPHR